MDAVTYSNSATVEFVTRHMIPLRVFMASGGSLPQRFAIQYTPTRLVLDGEGTEHYRAVGFESTNELIPAMMFGIGKAHFDRGDCKRALPYFETIVAVYAVSKVSAQAGDFKRACISRGARS